MNSMFRLFGFLLSCCFDVSKLWIHRGRSSYRLRGARDMPGRIWFQHGQFSTNTRWYHWPRIIDPTALRIPPLNVTHLLESNPLKSRLSVCELTGLAKMHIWGDNSSQCFMGQVYKGHAYWCLWNKSFCVRLGHATQKQKLQSSPRFVLFKADFPDGCLIWNCVVSQTAYLLPGFGLGLRSASGSCLLCRGQR